MEYELLSESFEYLGLGIIFGFSTSAILSLLGYIVYKISQMFEHN